MTAWMLYAAASSAIIALAALFVEFGLRGRRVALRGVWILAMTGSVALSVAPWVGRPDRSAEALGLPTKVTVSVTGVSAGQPFAIDGPPARAPAFERLAVPTFPGLDRVLIGVAGILGATGLVVLAGSYRRLARRRRSWRATTVEGVPALISRSIGPAVVGYLHPAIVLPEWVAGMDERRRRLVVLHEQEHIHAKDNQLLGLATLVVMLMPWNVALWWQLRRLRQGVELDCDRRVLARAPDQECYGELLIEMGQRSSTRAFALAAFAESSTFLDRRIRHIVASRPGTATLVLGPAAALVVASFLLAWAPPSPRRIEASVFTPSLATSRMSVAAETPVAEPAQSTGGVPKRETPTLEEAVPAPAAVGELRPAIPPVPGNAPVADAAIARRPSVEALLERDYPEVFTNGLPVDRAVWFAIDRSGTLRGSWIGPNLYINVGAANVALREFELPVGSPERAAAEAEHQRLERDILQANVPDLEIRSMYAGYFAGGGGSAVVHFVTEHPGAGNWGRFRVASAFVADAVDSALGR